MLDMRINIDGAVVVIDGFKKLAAEFPNAIDKGLTRVAIGVERQAFAWLSGPGGAAKKDRTDYLGFSSGKFVNGSYSTQSVMFRSYHTAGAYPVPVRTGNLRDHLDFLRPNTSKSGPAGTFTAGRHEVVVYDSAEYADPIFKGTGSSAKFGERDALKDGLEMFNRGSGIMIAMDQEVRSEIKNSGLA